MSLELKDIKVKTADKEIVKGISLVIRDGEIHVIMGPNGAGKSSLVNALLRHPKYELTGQIKVDGNDITQISPEKKAKAGLFLSMQHSPEIPGVTVAHFLRVAKNSLTGTNQNPFTFHNELLETMKTLEMDQSFATRYLNTGFSGGEKKRTEILQLLILNPKFAILDETDSGLDIDALRTVGNGIRSFHKNNNGVLLITHHNALLKYIVPNFVHIMMNGKIVESGGPELADEVEKNGYAKFLKI